MKTKYLIIFLIFILNINFAYCHVIIVNKANPISKLSKSEIRNIYLGNTINWKDSRKIQIVDYNSESELREVFSDDFLYLSPNKVSMIWLKVTLSGKMSPPKILYKSKDVVKYISDNPDAIGYIDSSNDLPADVKVIEVE